MPLAMQFKMINKLVRTSKIYILAIVRQSIDKTFQVQNLHI